VLNKTSFTIGGVILSCAIASVPIAKPANAEPVSEQHHSNSSEMLVSQLRGHETYQDQEQLNPNDYVYGTVKGAAGSMLSIELEEGDSVLVESTSARPGDDVILTKEGDDYEFVGQAQPAWIMTLQEDYKLNMAAETGSATSSTTSVEQEEMEQTDTVTPSPAPVPEPQQTEPAPAPEEEPAEPVQGLW
jgi:hypothetical protein